MRVAIQPDDYTLPQVGKCDASSPRWAAALEAAGHEVRWVDVHRPDILAQLRGCDGFMWRHGHGRGMQRIAKRLLPVVERELGLCVYPDQRTCWHYDDKIAQAYLFEALRIPTPKTTVWFEARAAREWARGARYPLVLKLAAGAGSTHVRLVESAEQATAWVDQLFGGGTRDLADDSCRLAPWSRRLRDAARALLRGRTLALGDARRTLHRDYALFQEFLPGNAFDTRVTVIGNRAFGYRRFNRPGDFRASGSGHFDPDPAAIDLETVHLGFRVARALGAQSVAIDGLRHGEERLVAEVSYAYVSWMVHDCPGHWVLSGEPESGDLAWVEGAIWPEEAQIQDYLVRLEARRDAPEP